MVCLARVDGCVVCLSWSPTVLVLYDDQSSLLIGFTHTLLLFMACQGKGLIHSRASLSPKGNKSSRRVSIFSGSRRNLILALSNDFSILSTRQMFAFVLSVTVLLVHIRMPERLMKASNCFHQCKKMSLWNGSPCSQTLAIALASKRSEQRLRPSVAINLGQLGSFTFFHITQRSCLESHQGWIQNEHRHSINPLLNVTSSSWRQSSMSMGSPPRTSTIWMRRVSNMVVGIKLRHRNTWFHIPSAPSTSYRVPTSSLSRLWIVLQLMEVILVQQSSLKGNNNTSRHGLMSILRYRKVPMPPNPS
jgi:hypothetical protein